MINAPPIPSAAELRQRLEELPFAQVKALSASSGVPFTTLWKIRTGATADPRLESVRALLPRLIELEALAKGRPKATDKHGG